MAPISVGIVSCGLVTVGAVGFSLVGMGTVGIGLLAMGAASISNLSTVNQTFAVILGVVALLVIAPVVWYSRVVRKNYASRP